MFCHVKVERAFDATESIEFEGRVDTSTTWLTLTMAWKEKFESLGVGREVNYRRNDGKIILGEVCGPVKIILEGFRPSFGEVNWVDLEPIGDKFIPLIGSLQLESSQALLDRANNRLIPMERFLLK